MPVETRRILTADSLTALVVVAGCLLLGLAGLQEWYWSAAIATLLAIRRTAPVVMLGLVGLVSGVHVLASHSFMFPGDLVSLVAVYNVAAHRRRRLAEQDSAMRAQLAVHEERTRISQEMHDIIAHSLASIIAQAEGGRVAARADAQVAGPLSDRIAGIGRETLTDVKRLLTVVDSDDHDRPAKGLRELPELLANVADAGLDVQLSTEGPPQSLGPGMDLAVYRVIQECLTNVLKHSPRPQARLRLGWAPALLTVSVTSPLDPADHHPMVEGRGLSGIRQRCSLFHGDCAVSTGSSLTVTTTWPLPPQGAP
ncbi:sensor histidine kinase [Micromonospora sp. WMMA1923]|uniref:sensor histidine kinase n=1 Tax=Micromonospora sp. WMMA1923 TaxID=3404125 RepID=UPI003B9509AB